MMIHNHVSRQIGLMYNDWLSKKNSFKTLGTSKEAIQWIFSLSRKLGIFPYNENYLLVYRSFCIILVYLLVSIIGVIFVPSNLYSHVRKNIMWIYIDNFTTDAGILCTFLVFVFKKDSLLTLVSLLEVFDDERFDLIWLPDKIFIFLGFIFFSFNILLHSLICYQYISYIGCFYFLCSMLFSWLCCVVMSQYIAFLCLLGSLYDRLKALPDPWKIVKCHETLNTIGSLISDLYGLGICFIVFNQFYCLIWNAYYNFHYLEQLSTERIGMQTLWMVSHMIRLCQFTFIPSKLKGQAQEVYEFLYKVMIEDKTNNLILNDLLELHLICWQQLEFSACGFFVLDKALICSMIACATTYLTILLQYNRKLEIST